MPNLKPEDYSAKIHDLYQYERTKQIEPWAALWDSSARVTFPHDVNTGKRDVVGKEAIVAWTAKKFVDRLSSEINVRIEPMATGRRVLATLDVVINFVSGVSIRGPLAVVFTFNEDGKITLMEEFVNEAQWPANYKDLAKATIAAAVSAE